jgi:hypothetical protein
MGESIRTIILLELLLQLRDKLVLFLLRLGFFFNFGLLQTDGFVKLLVEQLSFLQDGKDN